MDLGIVVSHQKLLISKIKVVFLLLSV